MYKFTKIFITVFLVVLLISINTSMSNEKFSLTIEIHSDQDHGIKRIDFLSEDIEKVGINDTLGITRVEIILATKYHKMLQNITKQNLGKQLIIKLGTLNLSSGQIRTPMKQGYIGISCLSKEEVEKIIKKIGRKPDYHLKHTLEELEDGKIYTEPANNPWMKKAMDAALIRDYLKAKEYFKKAIESDPQEPLFYMMFSAMYYTQGKKKLALEELLKADAVVGKDAIHKYPGIYISLGELYADLGSYDNAIESYQKLLSADNNNLNAHLYLARVYEKIGQYNLAMKEFFLLSESEIEYFKKFGLEGIRRLRKQSSDKEDGVKKLRN